MLRIEKINATIVKILAMYCKDSAERKGVEQKIKKPESIVFTLDSGFCRTLPDMYVVARGGIAPEKILPRLRGAKSWWC